MNTKDPKLVALQFNECINNQNLKGLERLMSEDHASVDSDGTIERPRPAVLLNWKKVFEMLPQYRNTFMRVESRDNLVVIVGHTFWTEKRPIEPVIWTARITNDLVQEWRVFADTPENRKRFGIT